MSAKRRKFDKDDGERRSSSRKRQFKDRTPYNFAAYASGVTNTVAQPQSTLLSLDDEIMEDEAQRLFGHTSFTTPTIIPPPLVSAVASPKSPITPFSTTPIRTQPSIIQKRPSNPKTTPKPSAPTDGTVFIAPPHLLYSSDILQWVDMAYATIYKILHHGKKHQADRAENLLFVLNGPSGSGKNKLVGHLCYQLTALVETFYNASILTHTWQHQPHEDTLNMSNLLFGLADLESKLQSPEPYSLVHTFQSPIEYALYLNSPAARKKSFNSPISSILVLSDLDILFELMETYCKSTSDMEALVAALGSLMACKGVIVFVTTASRNSYWLRKLLKQCAYLQPQKTCFDFPLPNAHSRNAWFHTLVTENGGAGVWKKFEQQCRQCGWENLAERHRAKAVMTLLESHNLTDLDLGMPNTMSQWLCELNWRLTNLMRVAVQTVSSSSNVAAKSFSFDYFARNALLQLTPFAEKTFKNRLEWLQERLNWWETILANMSLTTVVGQMYHGMLRSVLDDEMNVALVPSSVVYVDMLGKVLWRDEHVATLSEFAAHVLDLSMKTSIRGRNYASSATCRKTLYLTWTPLDYLKPSATNGNRFYRPSWIEDIRAATNSLYASSPSFADWCEYESNQSEMFCRFSKIPEGMRE